MHLELEKSDDKGNVNMISRLITAYNTTGFDIAFNSGGDKADKSFKDEFFEFLEVRKKSSRF